MSILKTWKTFYTFLSSLYMLLCIYFLLSINISCFKNIFFDCRKILKTITYVHPLHITRVPTCIITLRFELSNPITAETFWKKNPQIIFLTKTSYWIFELFCSNLGSRGDLSGLSLFIWLFALKGSVLPPSPNNSSSFSNPLLCTFFVIVFVITNSKVRQHQSH